MIKYIKANNIDDESRIDRWLKRRFSSLKQSYIENKLRRGLIKVNKSKIKSNYKVKSNDIISICGYTEKEYFNYPKILNKKIIPKPILLNFKKSIIYECSDFLILNKWSGISSQGASNISISINDIIKNISYNYNLVHRLDKETSGLLIIAKNHKSTKIFASLFKYKKINKLYIAICQGIPRKLDSTVKLKINTKDKYKTNVQTFTKYNVVLKCNNTSIIAYKPMTGKMHQLRIVSKYIDCPIIGDLKYNNNHINKNEKLKLNAYCLKFKFKNREYKFKSILPKDFRNFAKKMKFPIFPNNNLKLILKTF